MWYFLSALIFSGIVASLIFRDRKNWEFDLIFFSRRTRKGIRFLKRVAKISPGFWKIVGIIAIMVCIYLLFDGISVLTKAAGMILAKKITQPTGGLLLPNPQPAVEVGRGYILIPFWFWILLIPLIMIPHEFMHGIMAAAEKIKMKSVGLIFLLVVPGAFVEPDEKSFQKSKLLSKIKVASMGSFANFLMALLFVGISIFMWPVLVNPNGIYLTNVTAGSPAQEAGLMPGMIITGIDNTPIKTSALGWEIKIKKNPGDNITYNTLEGNYTGVVGFNKTSEKLYIGIKYRPRTENWSLVSTVYSFFMWAILLEYWIAIFNILPIYPLDGGLIVKSLVETKAGKKWKYIVAPLSIALIALLVFIIFAPGLV